MHSAWVIGRILSWMWCLDSSLVSVKSSVRLSKIQTLRQSSYPGFVCMLRGGIPSGCSGCRMSPMSLDIIRTRDVKRRGEGTRIYLPGSSYFLLVKLCPWMGSFSILLGYIIWLPPAAVWDARISVWIWKWQRSQEIYIYGCWSDLWDKGKDKVHIYTGQVLVNPQD